MTTPKNVRAAAVQLSPVLYSCQGTTAKVCDAIAEAAKKGAELVVFPETVLPYYPYFSFIKAPAVMGADHLKLIAESVTVPGPVTEQTRRRPQGKQAPWLRLGSMSATTARCTMPNSCSMPTVGSVQARRKITPTYHERMVWGQGDGSGLRAVDTAVGRIGALACWEHYNPLARYAMMTEHEQIHVAMFPGSLVGNIFREQIEVTIRHHALESGCFVVNAHGLSGSPASG